MPLSDVREAYAAASPCCYVLVCPRVVRHRRDIWLRQLTSPVITWSFFSVVRLVGIDCLVLFDFRIPFLCGKLVGWFLSFSMTIFWFGQSMTLTVAYLRRDQERERSLED